MLVGAQSTLVFLAKKKYLLSPWKAKYQQLAWLWRWLGWMHQGVWSITSQHVDLQGGLKVHVVI